MLNKGTTQLRFPDNDPENGPAYKQVWDGEKWTCAGHKFCQHVVGGVREDDNKTDTGCTYVATFCEFCGAPPLQ